jgi:hypothetical protein
VIACIVCGEIAQGLIALFVLCVPLIRGYIKRHNVHGDNSCSCECHSKCRDGVMAATPDSLRKEDVIKQA